MSQPVEEVQAAEQTEDDKDADRLAAPQRLLV
jgi:hypothetical protein